MLVDLSSLHIDGTVLEPEFIHGVRLWQIEGCARLLPRTEGLKSVRRREPPRETLMSTGLTHLHHAGQYLMYLPLILVVLALAGARTKPGLAKVMGRIHTFGFLMPGRLVYIVGIALTFMTGRSFTEHFILAGLILWVPVEIVAKRMVKAELAKVADGGEASGKLTLGAVIECVLIIGIVMAMQHGH